MKGLYSCLLLILFSSAAAFSQTIQSSGVGSGEWSDPLSWTPNTVPIPANSSSVIINSGHTITVTDTRSIDQLSVSGILIINNALTLANGAGNEITVNAGGVLTLDGGSLAFGSIPNRTVLVNGTLNNNGAFNTANPSRLMFGSGSNYNHQFADGGTIPSADWDANSTVNIVGYTSGSSTAPVGLNQTFGHFVWDAPGQDATIILGGLPTSINGDFRVESTGTDALFYSIGGAGNTMNIGGSLDVNGGTFGWTSGDAAPSILNIAGNIDISGGYVQLADDMNLTVNVAGNFVLTDLGLIDFSFSSAVTNLNIQGNYTHSGESDIYVNGGTGNINFIGASAKVFNSSISPSGSVNYSVAALSTLDVLEENFIGGGGNFTLNGTLRVGSIDQLGALQTGTLSGNLRIGGTRTYASNATIIYAGLGPQFIGNGFPSGGDINLSIDNSSGVTLSTSLDIVALRTLNLASGNIVIGSQTLTVNGTVTGAGGVVGGPSSNLVIGGTGNFGILTFNGTNELLNFTLNRTGSGLVTLGGNLTVLGTFTHTNGTLAIADNIFTISGDYEPASPALLSVTSLSSIVIDGTGSLPTDIGFVGTDMGTLTLNRANATLPTTSSIAIENLNLFSGIFDNGTGIAIAQGGTITRLGGASGGSMTGNPTNTVDAYNVVYTSGEITTGPELPSNSTALANLSKIGSGVLTLGSDITVNGNLVLSSGSFNAGSRAIDMKGNFVSNAGSILSSSTTTFSGTTVVSGSSTPTFGSVTITGTLTPSSTFQVLGNIANNGTLNAGSGTIIFGGVTVISGSSISSFGNVTITGSLTAPTGNFNVSGNWTNNGIFVSGSSGNTVTFNGSSSILGSTPTNFRGVIISGVLNSPATLNVAGNFTNNGTFNAGTGTLVLNGGTGQSIGGTTITNFNNITVNKASGIATVSSNQNIINALTISGAGNLNANGRLTLVSTASGDARIAEITGGGSITGNIIAQRYLPNTDAVRAYRYLASPVTNANVSDWKAEFPITGTFNDPSTAAEWPGIPGIIQTNKTLFIYNEAHTPTSVINDRYESYPLDGTSSTASPIVNGRGYAAWVRQGNPITLNLTGLPRQGDVAVNVTAQTGGGDDGWNLIGNPYAAPISWSNVTRPAGVNDQIALQDNTDNIGLGAGAYVYFAGGLGVPASYTGTIASGQGFWVRATAAATITFQENDKQAVSNPDFIREAPTKDILRINIAGNNRQDEMVIHFSDAASDESDAGFDAFKLKNDFVNLSSFSSDSVKMAINVLGRLSCNKEVGLVVDGVTPGTYTFNFSQFESFGDKIQIRLLDNFTGTTFDLRVENPTYQFSVSADVNTFGKKRFKVYLTYPDVETALNLLSEDVCLGNNASVTIEDSQEGIKYYSTINGNTVSDEVLSDGGNVQLTVTHDQLGQGENTLVLMASAGGCSAVPLDNSVVINTDSIYAVKSTMGGKVCGEGQVTLSAAGAPVNGSYKWYETVDSTTPIEGQTMAEFITPVLDKTKTYFVSAVNALGCEGERKEISAEVLHDAAVAITIDEQKLLSSYAQGNQWYFNGEPVSGATGQSIQVTETGLYEVEVTTAGGCTTRTSQEMIVMGTEYGEFANGFNFYPNPVEGNLHIELPDLEPASGVVHASFGKPVGEVRFVVSGGKMTGEYNFREQAAGLYLIRILQGNKIIQHKIIKK